MHNSICAFFKMLLNLCCARSGVLKPSYARITTYTCLFSGGSLVCVHGFRSGCSMNQVCSVSRRRLRLCCKPFRPFRSAWLPLEEGFKCEHRSDFADSWYEARICKSLCNVMLLHLPRSMLGQLLLGSAFEALC